MRLIGILFIIFTILSLNTSVFDNHSTSKSQSCQNLSLEDCRSHVAEQTQKEQGQKEHTHCAVHCAPILLNGLISKLIFDFILLKNSKNFTFSFVLTFPILEGPFKPPQA